MEQIAEKVSRHSLWTQTDFLHRPVCKSSLDSIQNRTTNILELYLEVEIMNKVLEAYFSTSGVTIGAAKNITGITGIELNEIHQKFSFMYTGLNRKG